MLWFVLRAMVGVVEEVGDVLEMVDVPVQVAKRAEATV